MGKVESMGLGSRLRLAGEATLEAGEAPGDGVSSQPELLDLLAVGRPAAFATDSRDRVVFWNSGAAALFGRSAEEALGRRCHEVTNGRDVFGNRFCYPNCPVNATLREEGSVAGFELNVATNGGERRAAHVTILRIPSLRSDLGVVVHILQPIEPASRLARAVERLGGVAPAPSILGEQAAGAVAATEPPLLTGREREILQEIAAGLQNKEIAQRLQLSLATVRNHIHNILDKLGVHSKLEAVSLAFRSGWIRDGADHGS